MGKRKVASESFLNGCHDTLNDEPVSLKLVRSLAVSSGHAVYAFDDSQEAGERAENQRLDLAFVGLRMPPLNGFELVRRIRNS